MKRVLVLIMVLSMTGSVQSAYLSLDGISPAPDIISIDVGSSLTISVISTTTDSWEGYLELRYDTSWGEFNSHGDWSGNPTIYSAAGGAAFVEGPESRYVPGEWLLNACWAPGFLPQPGEQFSIVYQAGNGPSNAGNPATLICFWDYEYANLIDTIYINQNVPEPASVLLFTLGGIALRRKRRNHK